MEKGEGKTEEQKRKNNRGEAAEQQHGRITKGERQRDKERGSKGESDEKISIGGLITSKTAGLLLMRKGVIFGVAQKSL